MQALLYFGIAQHVGEHGPAPRRHRPPPRTRCPRILRSS